MADMTTGAEKSPRLLALEEEKLELEIQKLKVPPWLNPTYLALLTPLFVGAFTIYISFQSDFFEVTKKTLELSKARLEADNAKLLERRDLLEQQITDFETQRLSLEKEIDELRKKNQNAAIYSDLDGILKDDHLSINNSRVEALVGFLKSADHSQPTESAIRDYLERGHNDKIKGVLNYILVAGLEDEAAFGEFVELIKANNDFRYVTGFDSTYKWPESFRERLLALSIDLIALTDEENRRSLSSLGFFEAFFGDKVELSTFSTHERHAEAVAIVEAQARSAEASEFTRMHAVKVLMLLDPERSVTLVADLVTGSLMRNRLTNSVGGFSLEDLQARLVFLGIDMTIPRSYDRPQDWAEFRSP